MKFMLIPLILFAASSAPAQSVVSIANGSGDAHVRGQRRIEIFADPNPPGQLFDRWEGDAQLVERRDEWHARVKTGTKNINLTAVYRNAAPWVPSAAENVGSSQMRYFFPPNPVGVVFHFHGAGGSLNGLFTSYEQTIYARELVAAGFAVVTLNSADRVNAQWSVLQPPNNPDIVNVQTAITTFISRGLMTAQTPVFASGISNGGAFAPRVSLFLGLRGTAVFIATSNATIMQNTASATIWNIMQNDTTLAPGSVEEALSNFNILRSRGIPAEYNVLHPSPVFPERFRRVPALTSADSLAIHAALKSNGFLDANDMLISNPTVSNWQSAIPAQYSSSLPEIFDQLKIAYTEHQFFSDHNRRVVRFFNSLL